MTDNSAIEIFVGAGVVICTQLFATYAMFDNWRISKKYDEVQDKLLALEEIMQSLVRGVATKSQFNSKNATAAEMNSWQYEFLGVGIKHITHDIKSLGVPFDKIRKAATDAVVGTPMWNNAMGDALESMVCAANTELESLRKEKQQLPKSDILSRVWTWIRC